jgi:pyruvate formate lyase activating enzyme
MTEFDYLSELEACELCEHRCGVNRLAGEAGVCRVTLPVVASATLHPAPPESYTVFVAGCNFKCLNCQNWTISQYPDNQIRQRGFEDPQKLARECVEQLDSTAGRRMGADRVFFSGGEPTIHLPYIERVVAEARKIRPHTKVNFDTNGYLTGESLKRVLELTTSITFDLKAYHNEIHLALTGASSKPVLRNAEYIGRHAKDKLWEYRIVVIPKINEDEIKPLADFIADIDTSLRVSFLAFRPNFALEKHEGAARSLMDRCVQIGRNAGLENVSWAGYTGLSGTFIAVDGDVGPKYLSEQARTAGTYAYVAGCETHPRNCTTCIVNQHCKLKTYIPKTVA